MNKIEVNKLHKDYYELKINGDTIVSWERSDFRHLIEVIDNTITV